MALNIPADPLDKYGDSPLLIAAKKGKTDIAAVLLAAKSDPNVRARHGTRLSLSLSLPLPLSSLCRSISISRTPICPRLLSLSDCGEFALTAVGDVCVFVCEGECVRVSVCERASVCTRVCASVVGSVCL